MSNEVGEGAPASEALEGLLSVFRESFEMDVAFISQFEDGQQVLRKIEGAPDSFGVQEGSSFPLSESICGRIVDGRLPNLIPDLRAEEQTRELGVVEQAGIGA